MSTTAQITQITNGLRPLIEYVDLDLDDDLLIFLDVETIDNCFGFSRGKKFEQLTLNIADGTIELIDSDAIYSGKIKITLPDQLDEAPREDPDADDPDGDIEPVEDAV